MFCGKCGTKNDEGVKFCSTCGTPVKKTAANQTVQTEPGGEREFCFQGVATFNATNEDRATVTIVGTLLDAAIVFKVLAAAILVSFFLPFYRMVINFGFFSTSISLSGFRVAFGGNDSSGTIWGFVLFLIPVALFLLFQFKREIEASAAQTKGKLFHITAGLLAFGIIGLFSSRISLGSSLISIRPGLGFILSIFLYVVAAAVVAGFLLAQRQAPTPPPQADDM